MKGILINNKPNDNVHAYMITDYRSADHGHSHDGAAPGHHRKAGTSRLSARDSGNTLFAVDIINNAPNDDVQVLMITDHEGNHTLITSELLLLSPVDSSHGKAMMSRQVANKATLGVQGADKSLVGKVYWQRKSR